MAATEPLCLLIGIDPKNLSKEENHLLEAELFRRVCTELKELLRQRYKNYFYLMKFTKEQEDTMLEEKLLQTILNEIISSGEYDAQGIARYTNTHEDVINELISGLNTQPSARCFRKIIEIDRTARPTLYLGIRKKIGPELVKLYGME